MTGGKDHNGQTRVLAAAAVVIAVAALFIGLYAATIGLQNAQRPPQTLLRVEAVLGGNASSSLCSTFALPISCLSYNLTTTGPADKSNVVFLNVVLNRTCPTSCYAELRPVSIAQGPDQILLPVNGSAHTTGTVPGGALQLLVVETWGCATGPSCHPPSGLTVAISVVDLALVD